MIEVFQICEAICEFVNSKEWAFSFRANAEWEASRYAESVKCLSVIAVPESLENLKLTRNSKHTKNVAVLSLIIQSNLSDKSEVTPLANFVGSLKEAVLGAESFQVPSVEWLVSRSVPVTTVFVREHLEQCGVFTCGMAITFESVSK